MAGVRLSEIDAMRDKDPVTKAEHLAINFLEVFEPDEPLDREEIEEWMQINNFRAEDVKNAAKEALRRGWVEDMVDGLRLTASGKKKLEERIESI